MSDLPTAVLGRTGATVTKLAYGAMELRGRVPGRGGRDVSADEAKAILSGVLDAGINLIDTSPDYGASEELIGEFISDRRSEFFLSSKCGCPINPPPRRTAPARLHPRQCPRRGRAEPQAYEDRPHRPGAVSHQPEPRRA